MGEKFYLYNDWAKKSGRHAQIVNPKDNVYIDFSRTFYKQDAGIVKTLLKGNDSPNQYITFSIKTVNPEITHGLFGSFDNNISGIFDNFRFICLIKTPSE